MPPSLSIGGLSAGVEAISDDAWDGFCASSTSAWFWHTSEWHRFVAGSESPASESLRLVVRDGKEMIAAAPLVLEADRLGIGGWPCWSPGVRVGLSAADHAQVLRAVFAYVDRLCADREVAHASFRVSPLAQDFPSHALRFIAETTRFGYRDESRATQIIDLSLPIGRIWSSVSRTHRRAIRTGARSIAVSAEVERFDDFRAMLQRIGPSTAPSDRGLDCMRRWLSTGQGVLFTAIIDGRPAGYTYLILHASRAHSFKAVNEAVPKRAPVGHALQWHAIEWLQNHGYLQYELGLQAYFVDPRVSEATEKDVAIAAFKRHFGGVAEPYLIRSKRFTVAE